MYENASKTLPAKPPALGEMEKFYETQVATDSFIYTFRSITGKFKLFYIVLHTVYFTNVSSSVVFLFYFILCIDLIFIQVR